MTWEDILKDWRRPFITSVIKRTTQLVDNLDKDVESWVQTPTSFEDYDQEGNNGKIVCPLHGWKFSLDNGKCLTNNSKINLEEII